MSFTDPSNNDPLLHDIFTVGALTAGLPALGYLQNKNEAWGVTDKLTKFSQKLVGSDYLNNQMNRTLVSTTSSQLLSNSEQSLQKVLLSQFMALEEASPLHVLRTLQISNFLQPFTPLSSNNETIHISANSIRNQQHYYESLIKYINEDEQRKIKRKLEIKDLTRGMFFKNNTLYGVDSKGEINLDDVIIKNARLTMGSLKNGDIYSNNHILEKFANIIGSSIDKTGVKNSPLMVVGAKNGMDFSSKWMQSTLRFSMEVGYKTLDNPLAGIEEMFHGVGAGYTGVFQSNIWNKMKEISGKVQLGTNGNYNLGIKDSLKLSAKNIAVKGGATYLAYQGVDSVLRSLSPENGIFSEGLGTGLANVYASSRIAFAKVWSDKFQGYKEQQEQSAPGSTDLSTLLAFPLAGALAGAQVAYFNRIGMSSIKGIDQAANIYNVEKESKVLKSVLNFDTKLKPMKRNALIGGLIGGSLALPFLPGALIGSSSEELRQLYSGEKEVPEKSTKFWLFGGGAWDGCLIDTAKLIQLSGKLVQAKDIKVGDKLLTSSGNFEPVKKILSKTVNDKIYSVKTSFNTNGDTQITGNHEILTIHHTGGFSPSKLETSKIIKEWIPVELVKKSPYVRLFVPYYKPLEIKKEICFDLSSFNYFYDEALKSWVRVFENKLWSKNMNKEVEKISLLKCNTKLRNKLSKDFKLKYGISDIQFKNKLNDIRKAKKLNRISNQIKLSNFKSNKLVLNADLGLLLGFYAAEGCVTEDGRIIFSFHEDELEYQKKVLELMLLIFNLKGSIKRNKGKGICLVFCDKVISKMIQQMIPGKTIDKTKRMNEYLLDAPEDFCYKFLEGVIKGDGSLGTFNSSIVIGMTDCPLPRQIQLLLTRFKIFSSIVRKKVHDLWDSILLNIPSSACYELNRKIEIKTLATNTIVKPKKNFGYTRLDDGFAVSIKSIETSEYNGIVYDFEIDGESNFFGTGFLLHNSHIKFHTKNWVARARADATDKVRYGDDETKKKLDPFLHPFSYLKDPYKLEKRNAESMPYPVWGMDVSYGSFFGKIFERTVGQIIKPDVINPAYKDAIMQGTEYTPVASSEGGGGGLGIVASDVLHAKQNVGKSFVEASKSLFSSSSNKKLQGIDNKDASLINEGLMLAPNTPGYDPNQEGMSLSYRALMDFTGIKGWGSSLVVDGLGLEPGVNSIQLARSGEASSGARDLLEQNLGDLMGAGEFQRKLLPTSSGALPDRFNPIANNAPSWLPSDKSQYFVDFKHGNMYDAVDRGEERLPGVGLESLYPELKGVDAEDYSLVFKHKILSNVAKGSEEFINARKQAIEAYQQGKLSANEIDILGTTLDQELERDRKKDFYDTPSKFQGPLGSVHNALWETIRANAESPLEMLTPIRPAAKFLHKRTAIEDYMETQLGGPDTAIWTNPYSHFIKPALNKTRQSLDVSGTFIPEEAKEKFNIDEYFDKFKYLKARRSNSEFQSDSTVIGASMSGLNTKDKVLKFKRSLQDDQKDYFDSFSQETNIDKRNKIRAMLPEDVRRGYEQIWHNMDIAKKARSRGSNIQEAIGDSLSEQTDRLSSLYNVDLTTEDKQKARAKVAANSDNYVGQGINTSKRIQYTEDELLRRKMADREALTYVNSKTGVPNTGFVGWDPRLTIDDIKIRTLSIGGQDLKRFGYWKKDEERMNRLQGIVNTDTVFTDIDRIKEDIRSDRRMKRSIENVMFDNGFRASKIDLVDSNYSSILVREE